MQKFEIWLSNGPAFLDPSKIYLQTSIPGVPLIPPQNTGSTIFLLFSFFSFLFYATKQARRAPSAALSTWGHAKLPPSCLVRPTSPLSSFPLGSPRHLPPVARLAGHGGHCNWNLAPTLAGHGGHSAAYSQCRNAK